MMIRHFTPREVAGVLLLTALAYGYRALKAMRLVGGQSL